MSVDPTGIFHYMDGTLFASTAQSLETIPKIVSTCDLVSAKHAL